MLTVYPSYYPEFKCRASACAHTCCADWEIDIDPASLKRYSNYPEICRRVITPDGVPQFFRHPDGRCAFLRPDGLCAMICEYGENMLCDICADHPRFRNFFSDRVEIGLGLCCEAAADLILSRAEPIEFITVRDDRETEPVDDDEAYILELRADLFRILRDRSAAMNRRLAKILDFCECDLPDLSGRRAREILMELERLDPDWKNRIAPLESVPSLFDFDLPESASAALEQLACYFIWRHLAPAAVDDALTARVRLCVFLTLLCANLIAPSGVYDHQFGCDIVRMLSGEIEYSDENIETLIDIFDT